MRLDNTARINTPGVAEGNWSWRVGDESLWERLEPEATELRALAKKAFRCNSVIGHVVYVLVIDCIVCRGSVGANLRGAEAEELKT